MYKSAQCEQLLSHTYTLTMEAISEFGSLTTCSIKVDANLTESRSEKFQENEKKKWTLRKVLKGTFDPSAPSAQ